MTERERAIAWRHAQHAAVCDHAYAWEHGTVVFASAVPGFWTYNSVRVEGPADDLDADALVAAADRLQRALRHRHVELDDEATGARLRPGVERHGWMTERLAWMRLGGPAHGDRAPVEIGEVPFRSTRRLREAWATDWAPSAAEWRRFVRLEEQVADLRGTRSLAAQSPAGELVGFAAFASGGEAAEVEQVYVDPAQRGGGIGGALVAAAVAAAGTARTYIVADDEGDPKRLYARLGFAPVWIQHVFTRRPT